MIFKMLFLVADGEQVLRFAGAAQKPYLVIASDIESNHRKHIQANMRKRQWWSFLRRSLDSKLTKSPIVLYLN